MRMEIAIVMLWAIFVMGADAISIPRAKLMVAIKPYKRYCTSF